MSDETAIADLPDDAGEQDDAPTQSGDDAPLRPDVPATEPGQGESGADDQPTGVPDDTNQQPRSTDTGTEAAQ